MALSPRERNMVVFLVLIALGGGAFLLLSGGGDEPDDAAPPQVVPTGAPISPTPIGPSPSPGPGRPPPPPLAIVTGRDPFVPLVVAEAGAGATGTAPAEVGEEPQPPVEEPGPGAEQDEQPGVTIGGRQVTLVEVFRRGGEQVARVEVDGETFAAAEGERFAGNFRVVSIEGECATLLFGDETFRVCIPEQGK